MSIRVRQSLAPFVLGAFGAFGALACDHADLVADRFAEPGTGGGGSGTQASAGGAVDSGGRIGTGGVANAGGSAFLDAGTARDSSVGSGGAPTVPPDGGPGGDPATDGGDEGGTAAPPCDDGNACTLDSVKAGHCVHEPVPDGLRCEDGDFCTLGDRCVNGVCSVGSRASGSMRALGQLETYGTGSVVTPGDGRFVFVDQPEFVPRITETRVNSGVLETLDTLQISAVRSTDPPVATAWGDLVAVAGDSESVEIGGDPRILQIVTVSSAGKLTAAGTVPMGGDAITSMVGRGHRLFVCTNFSFFTPPSGTLHWIDATDASAPVEVASGPLGVGCGSLAASEDGARVYVNTPGGVRFTDLSTWIGSGPLTFATDPIVPADAGLALRGNELLARTGDQIHLLSETTHQELGSFAVPGAHAAGFTDAGIFVQGDRAAGAGSEYFIALYTEAGQLLRERTLTTFASLRDITSAKPAVGTAFVTDTIDNQIFAVDPGGFTPILEPRVGTLYRLFAGQGAVHARGLSGTQRIDVTDPAHPAIVAGGPDQYPKRGLQLDESLNPGRLLPEVDPNSLQLGYQFVEVKALAGHASDAIIERITVAADERRVHSGSIRLPGGDAVLLSAGDFIYRVGPAAEGAHLKRWLMSDLRAGVTEPSMDVVFDAAVVNDFDVDPSAQVAVALTGTTIQWVDLSADPPAVTVMPNTAKLSRKIKVRGHRVAGMVDGSNLGFAELGSADTEVVSDTAYNGAYVEDILGYDGNVAYLSSDIPGGVIIGSAAVQAVRRGVPADQALVGEVRMSSVPTSLCAMDGSLVVGSATELVTLAPSCQ